MKRFALFTLLCISALLFGCVGQTEEPATPTPAQANQTATNTPMITSTPVISSVAATPSPKTPETANNCGVDVDAFSLEKLNSAGLQGKIELLKGTEANESAAANQYDEGCMLLFMYAYRISQEEPYPLQAMFFKYDVNTSKEVFEQMAYMSTAPYLHAEVDKTNEFGDESYETTHRLASNETEHASEAYYFGIVLRKGGWLGNIVIDYGELFPEGGGITSNFFPPPRTLQKNFDAIKHDARIIAGITADALK